MPDLDRLRANKDEVYRLVDQIALAKEEKKDALRGMLYRMVPGALATAGIVAAGRYYESLGSDDVFVGTMAFAFTNAYFIRKQFSSYRSAKKTIRDSRKDLKYLDRNTF